MAFSGDPYNARSGCVGPLPFYQQILNPEKYDVVAAIDFGTSFSGFAFSFNHRDGNDDIYMNREWGNAQGYSTLKTPTCILLNQDKTFVKFGFEAAEKYAELEDAIEDKKFYCFDRVKMMLHGSEVCQIMLYNQNKNNILFLIYEVQLLGRLFGRE